MDEYVSSNVSLADINRGFSEMSEGSGICTVVHLFNS